MDTNHYEIALKQANEELERLVEEQEALEARIAGLRQTVAGLRAILNKEPLDGDVGLTDAIRQILAKDKNIGYTPTGVKNALLRNKFDIKKYSSPLSVIHTVLKRLVTAGEATAFSKEGKTYYQWRKKQETATPSQQNPAADLAELLKVSFSKAKKE